MLAQLIATGALEQHIRSVRKRQRIRRDALLGALRSALPQARVQGVPAGLHLLITFPELPVADTDLAERIHRPACRSTHCHGMVSDPGCLGSCWATRPTRPTSCARRPAALVRW